jgi:hypothetical protein
MGDFTDPWEEYRKRRNLALLAGLGFLPVLFVVLRATERQPHEATAGIVIMIAWLAFMIVTSIRCERFRCPRCGKWFFARAFYHNAFARRCLHCGLPKYAVPEQGSLGPQIRDAS